MTDDTSLPFEVGIEKAKSDLTKAINSIGKEYSIPSSLMTMILESILNESKMNTYSTIISYYDISHPSHSSRSETLQNDDVEMTEKSEE